MLWTELDISEIQLMIKARVQDRICEVYLIEDLTSLSFIKACSLASLLSGHITQ